MNSKPRLKPGMNIFVGCAVGEKRSGLLTGAEPFWSQSCALVRAGYLQIVADEGKRVWFGLTEKGKEHVARVEKFYAVW